MGSSRLRLIPPSHALRANPGGIFPPPGLTATELEELVASHEIAVIHVDAEWDGYRKLVAQQMRAQQEPTVGFGYVDIDADHELACALQIVNVPTVIYYPRGEPIATLVGLGQPIVQNIQRLRSGSVPRQAR
ncbi:MAG: thioredoxin family protein [Sandaracinaceae bacterium]